MMARDKIPLSAFDALSDAVAIAEADGGLLFINQAFSSHFGINLDLLSGGKDEYHKALVAALTQAVTSLKPQWQGSVTDLAGQSRSLSLKLRQIEDEPSKKTFVIAVVEPEPTSGNVVWGGNNDAVTGLPVQAFLLGIIEHSIQTQKRHGGSVVLIVLGLDNFTVVNDALGMAAGDTLLSITTERIKASIRESDSAFRLDGDRFGILMTVTSPDDIIIVAEKLLSAMREPYVINGQDIISTSSMGIAAYPSDTDNAGEMIKMAENSLHHAKESGRNQYQFFSKDMNGKAISRLTLASKIRKAIGNNEFLVYYQPKVRSDDNTIMGAEALARWEDPELGVVMPDQFIPVAEETGLIEMLGKRILEIACTQAYKWYKAGFDPITISVNVSPRQFRSSNFIPTLEDILKTTNLPPHWLELEITESMIMLDLEAATKTMAVLRTMGVGLSIDDFGTGYSSLSYLGNFPLTALKIDRAFVNEITDNPKKAEVARAIINLSKGLKLDVVAEGCEIPEHLKFLKEHGCDAVQGFYFSKAVPAQDFEAMLRAGIVYPVPSIEF